MTDRITIVAQPSADVVHQSLVRSLPSAAAGTDLGARVGVLMLGSTVLSVQGLAHIPFGPVSPQAGYFDQSRVPATDLRLLLGHGFQFGTAPAFIDVEASHSWEGDGLPQEWHGVLDVGLRPYPQLLFMLASFATVASHPAGGCVAWVNCWSWLKLQPSVVYDLSRHWSVELGFLRLFSARMRARTRPYDGALVSLLTRYDFEGSGIEEK